jgi:CHAT domain-containing protein
VNAEDGSATILPQEYLETQDLGRLYPQSRLARQPQPSEMLRMLAGAEVFHFSGHTVERNHSSALLLAGPDGILSATTLAHATLRACWIAVLATCSSGGGSDFGVEDRGSLAHALLLAGVGHVVATLWDVDTRSLRTLMLGFHRSLRETRAPEEALRRAQQAVSAAKETSHPFFWAGVEVFSQ